MKKSIAELPMMTAPQEKEELIIYLAAAKEAISAVLMTERDGKQIPIYFVSRALRGPKINYTPMEKLVLALVRASKQLKRYFQAHTVIVITDQPIKQMLSNPEVTGRLLKWSFELDTPFSLTYGTEAVILTEVGMPTLRTTEVNLEENKEALEINLDLLEERREQAAIREASKAKMETYYNSKVQSVSFKPGDLVYRNNEASRVEDTGKLGPKWKGPYEVTEALEKGAYKLRDRDGNQLPRTWNISNLKKCYVHKM
ncbi:reverse transcriptase domain-containing protein [Tanacetum coccineum]